MIGQAEFLARELHLSITEIEWGRGLICRWDGDLDGAWRKVSLALQLAREEEDRWRELQCLIWLAKIELERAEYLAVQKLTGEIDAVAARMGDPACRSPARCARWRGSRKARAMQAAL